MKFKLFITLNIILFYQQSYSAEGPHSYNNEVKELKPVEELIFQQYGKPIAYATARQHYNNMMGDKNKSVGCALCNKVVENNNIKNRILRIFDNGTVVKINDFPFIPGQLLIYHRDHKKALNDLSLEERSEVLEVIPPCINSLKKVLNAETVLTGINVERAGGASIPEHMHIQLIPYFENLKKDYLTTCMQDNFNAPNLDQLYKDLKPYFDHLLIPKHKLKITHLELNQINETTINCSNECSLCAIMLDKNNHFVLQRFQYNAVIQKPFPDAEGQLLIVPLSHNTHINDLNFQSRSELTELISPLIEIMQNVLTTDGCNVVFNEEKFNNHNIHNHFNVEILPRYTGDGGSFAQRVYDVSLLAKNLNDISKKLRSQLKNLNLPIHELIE